MNMPSAEIPIEVREKSTAVVKAVLELFKDGKRWTEGPAAQRADNKSCTWDDPEAVRWPLVAALKLKCHEMHDGSEYSAPRIFEDASLNVWWALRELHVKVSKTLKYTNYVYLQQKDDDWHAAAKRLMRELGEDGWAVKPGGFPDRITELERLNSIAGRADTVAVLDRAVEWCEESLRLATQIGKSRMVSGDPIEPIKSPKGTKFRPELN